MALVLMLALGLVVQPPEGLTSQSSAPKATLVDASEDFYFRIKTIEAPALQLRHVSTHGVAANHGELSDAFMALMLSFRPGSYSSTSPLGEANLVSETSQYAKAPTLHWHFANRSCVNHHRNSKVTYLRLESAALLREPISLQLLADALGLTPRSVQACFKSVLAITPMSWLKLARIGKLRQLLWCGDMARFSIQQLMSRCGLSDSNLNRQYYKNAYGVSPKEERRQAEAIKRQYGAVKNDSQYYQFDNMQAAIQYLEKLNNLNSDVNQNCRVAIVVSSSSQHP